MLLRLSCTFSAWQLVRLWNCFSRTLLHFFPLFMIAFFLVLHLALLIHVQLVLLEVVLSSAHCALTLLYLSFCVLFDFSSSSTFKDPERASLRDSGHGDSDQADSDQDTNKGSCCDMSAKEALKLKAVGVKPPPLEQGELSQKHLSGSEMKDAVLFSPRVCV